MMIDFSQDYHYKFTKRNHAIIWITCTKPYRHIGRQVHYINSHTVKSIIISANDTASEKGLRKELKDIIYEHPSNWGGGGGRLDFSVPHNR